MPIDYSINRNTALYLRDKKNLKGANETYDSAIYHEYIDNKEYANAADYLSQYTFSDEDRNNKIQKMISDLRHRQTVRDYYTENISDSNERAKYLSAVDLVSDVNSNMRITGNGYYQTEYNKILDEFRGDNNNDTFRFYLDEGLSSNSGWKGFKSRVYDFFTPASYSSETTKSMFNALFGSINNADLRSNYGISINRDKDGEYVDVDMNNPMLIKILDKFSMLTYENHVNGVSKDDKGNYPVVNDHGNETPSRWALPRFKVYALSSKNPENKKELKSGYESNGTGPFMHSTMVSGAGITKLTELVDRAKKATSNIDEYNDAVDEYYGVDKEVDASTIYDAMYLHPDEVLLDKLRENGAIDGPEYKRFRDQYDTDIHEKLFGTFANAAQYPIYTNYTGESGDKELTSIMGLIGNAQRKKLGDIVLKALDDKRGIQVRAGYTSGMYGAYIMIGPEANTGEAKHKNEFYRGSIEVFIPNFTGLEEQMFGDNVNAQLNKERWDLDRWHKDYNTLSGGYIENRKGDYTYYINGREYNHLDEKSVNNIIEEDLNLRIAQKLLIKSLSESKNVTKESYNNLLNVAGKMVGDMITEKYGIENPYEQFHNSDFRNENSNAFKDYKRYYSILVGSILNSYDKEDDSFTWDKYGADTYLRDHITKLYQ